MKNPLPLSDLLTFQEAAAFLNTSESSIRRLMQQDPSFPTPTRFGSRLVRHSRTRLEEWLQNKSACL